VGRTFLSDNPQPTFLVAVQLKSLEAMRKRVSYRERRFSAA